LKIPSEIQIEKKLCKTALLNHFVKKTHFDHAEAEALFMTYKKLGEKNHGIVKRAQLRQFITSVYGISNDFMLTRIYESFDDDNNGTVGLEEWMSGLSIALKGTLDERFEYAFQVYDITNASKINKEELHCLLQNAVVKRPTEEDPEEGIKDLIEIAMQLLDVDRDGRISKADFKAAVQKQPLLLEAFGKCLPDSLEIQAFLATCMTEHQKDNMGTTDMFSSSNKKQRGLFFAEKTESSRSAISEVGSAGSQLDPSQMIDVGIVVKSKGMIGMASEGTKSAEERKSQENNNSALDVLMQAKHNVQ